MSLAKESWKFGQPRFIDDGEDALYIEFPDRTVKYVPERTCAFTDNWDDPDLPLPTCSACGWEAEETDCVGVIGGPMYLYDGKFCKECGAKVMD